MQGSGKAPGKAKRTADAVQRALEASGEVVVGNVSVVPNRRDGGARVFMEVLLLEAPAAPGGDDQEVKSRSWAPDWWWGRRLGRY
ncbi:hypothetical protein ABZZ79_35550 [Streptomyces sp. NPDC006458]|uniref:hypothetical protein n=1 Tax=Streptomyces sp. NPDC006458 TaxID=3154302 RepID=UPI0033A264B2